MNKLVLAEFIKGFSNIQHEQSLLSTKLAELIAEFKIIQRNETEEN